MIIMSIIKESGTCEITFASPDDKRKTFSYLIDGNIPFRGIGVNSLVVQKRDYNELKKLGIRFA